MSSLETYQGRLERALNNVGLLRYLSNHLNGDRPVELDSEETYNFLTRKKRPVKGTSISDEPGGLRHNSVLLLESQHTVEIITA
jgi:hypothetical protein